MNVILEKSRRPSRAFMNFILDIGSFVCLLSLISTGVLLHFILPPRSGRLTIWNFTRHEWGDVHFYLASSFVALLTIHLFLHGHWIRNIFAKKVTSQPIRLLIIAVAIALVGMTLAPFLLTPEMR
jgi:hypothetical protein